MKNLFLAVFGIIFICSCSTPSEDETKITENPTQSEDSNDVVTLIDDHLPEDLADSIWIFYHAVQDEMNVLGNTQDFFIGCEERDENHPINCDSLIMQITAGIENIKKMVQVGNQPELFANETIEVMLDFVGVLESFKEKEFLLTKKPKSEWTSEEIEFWNDFYNGAFDSNLELWISWRNDAGMNYIKANEEYVGAQ
jgi:hypothetical protein